MFGGGRGPGPSSRAHASTFGRNAAPQGMEVPTVPVAPRHYKEAHYLSQNKKYKRAQKSSRSHNA
ncbi:hypothetical protein GCM10007147_21960 [Nocardiopsis kunsanensis]|uniref:Uncharacterized protein n=1 Tax=Nocardiopsis kunsanensis TaxID=141693 RepID=A0A918XBK3_9ACTN|nr:hypothetical protein GCM10007147_21960 [Nocardiopsis kunsanensis]